MMKYGYFDNDNKEYVITNPELPTPWMNYLGDGDFGGIISATGGGLTFDGDPSNRRITRYRFNNRPIDRPGRYLYIYDTDTGDYFSPMWQPVQRDLQFYECRHGLSYTKISGQYNDVLSSTTFFVPQGKHYELWKTVLENKSDTAKRLKIFSYVEFSYSSAQNDDLCHWTTMMFRSSFDGKKIVVDCGHNQKVWGRGMYSYVSTDLEICGFDCDADRFIGLYNNESNPLAVENGECFNSLVEANNCVGVLCSEIELEPFSKKEFTHILGCCDSTDDIDSQIDDAFNNNENALRQLREKWESILNMLKVNTPSEEVNTMLNCWHTYQANTTFNWSRFISFYERGIDRGFGFRDSMQDVLGVMHSMPQKAKEKIKLLLSIQNSDGSALSVYYPATKKAVGGGRSDDHLWSILSVCNYVKETGDTNFLFEQIPFYDGSNGTVLEHLEKGIEFTMKHLGKHGIPDFLSNDWDDSLWAINMNGGAESVFVFFQLAHGVKELAELYTYIGNKAKSDEMLKIYDYCRSKSEIIWDGEWFIRAFTSDGQKYCTAEDDYNKIHMIPQSWSVISGIATTEQANTAFDNVMKYLYTDKGLITHYNASGNFAPEEKAFYSFPSGVRENGGIFFHANTWVIIALAMLGRKDDAYKCYYASLPNRRNDIADLCKTEPYVYSQTMIAPPSPAAWQCTNSWLTGTASWMYYAATQYILGIRPEYEGLCIEPAMPSEWGEFTAERICRNTKCKIKVKNGGTRLIVNGKEINGNIIPWNLFDGGILEIEKI